MDLSAGQGVHAPAFASGDDDPALGAPEVGPNAVLQLEAALAANGGPEAVLRVFCAADRVNWLAERPAQMLRTRDVMALYDALFRIMPDEAGQIAADAGQRTADYVLTNRIPAVARIVLKALPARLAAPILLSAIAKNAWTFGADGRLTTVMSPGFAIEITNNPLAMPGCVWHAGVFRGLFTALVSRHATVTHTACCYDGGRACRFEIDLP